MPFTNEQSVSNLYIKRIILVITLEALINSCGKSLEVLPKRSNYPDHQRTSKEGDTRCESQCLQENVLFYSYKA